MVGRHAATIVTHVYPIFPQKIHQLICSISIKTDLPHYSDMALEGNARFVSYEKSRTLIYVSKKVVDDSAFPFEPGDRLKIRIDGEKLIIEKSDDDGEVDDD